VFGQQSNRCRFCGIKLNRVRAGMRQPAYPPQELQGHRMSEDLEHFERDLRISRSGDSMSTFATRLDARRRHPEGLWEDEMEMISKNETTPSIPMTVGLEPHALLTSLLI
jgi:hypothetical protein